MAVVGTDLVMVERGGVQYKATAQDVADLGASGGGGETIILDGNGPTGTPAALILDGNG